MYQEAQYKKQLLSNLVDTNIKLFKCLKTKGFITEKQLLYFTNEHNKACNFKKSYLLPKIHKCLSNIPGRQFISNCGMFTEKVSEFLENQLESVMQSVNLTLEIQSIF